MGTKNKNIYQVQAAVIKAMAHPTRLLILNSLKGQETCVCALRALVGDDLSTVSKHLLVLRKAGLVASRREGKKIYYRLTSPCILNFSSCIAGIIKIL